MKLKNHNVLFFTRTMKLGGTEHVVLQLCEILQPLVNNVVVCSCGGINTPVLEEMGIKHYKIPDIENKSVKTIFEVCKTIKRIVKKENISVIHTHHRMAAFYVALLGLYKKCAFLNTSHNTFENKRVLTRFAYRHACLIACGEMVKKNLVDFFGVPDQQVKVIHNAVKPFKSGVMVDSLVAKLHGNNYFVIGNVGRLSEQKGMEYYIKAVPDVIKIHPEARFLIIGNGEDEEKLKKLVSELQLEGYIFFMGYRTDVQNIMSQIDMVVLSSLWEGLPLTPIEAFSVGRTIVATAVDGTVEIVEDGKSGLLIKPRMPEQIVEKIVWMIEHPVERRQMETAAKERFTTEFSFELLASKYVWEYEKLNSYDRGVK